jgi:hypothetical protein
MGTRLNLMTYRNQTTSKIVQNGLAAVQRGDLCHYFREMLKGWDGLRWRDGLKQLVKEIGNSTRICPRSPHGPHPNFTGRHASFEKLGTSPSLEPTEEVDVGCQNRLPEKVSSKTL